MTKDFSLFFSEKIDVDTNIIWFERSNKYIIVNDLLHNLILNKIDFEKYLTQKKILQIYKNT